MSSENVEFNIISNFNGDVNKFTDLLTKLITYKQTFNTHIKTLNRFDDLKSLAHDAEKKLTSQWETLEKMNGDVKESLFAIDKVLKLKGKALKQLDDIHKCGEKHSNNVVERDKSTEIRLENLNSQLKSYAKQNISAINNIPSEQNAKLLVPTDSNAVELQNAKYETGKKKASLNGEKSPIRGIIRVVPLQNLLSSPQKLLENSSNFPWVISDSDEDTNSSLPIKLLPCHTKVLSESDDDQVEEGKKSVLRLSEPKSGPRTKITPLRNRSEKIKSLRNEDSNFISSKKSKENSATCNLSSKDIAVKANYMSSEKKPIKDILFENTYSGETDSCPVVPTTDIESLFAKVVFKNEEKGKASSSFLIPKIFRKKCTVRINRIELTTNKSNIDKSKNRQNKQWQRIKEFKREPHQNMNNIKEVSDSSSEDEIVPARKKRLFKEKQAKDSDSDWDVRVSSRIVAARKKRKIIKSSSESTNEGSDNADGDKKQRKKIRKVINEKNLDDDTKRATKEEEERKRRIEERQKVYNKIYTKPENVEVKELILDFDEETKNTLLKVDDGLMKKLKPHQVNGVKFMWDACFETIKDCKDKPGSGCILAHCMGLGKTMQIVTLSHTLLTNSDATNIKRILVISPLSTLNNWAREFVHWMSFSEISNIEIYDMSKYKDKNARVFKLEEWFKDGGVCIMGYDMYRILSNENTKGMRKKQKESLQKCLVNPGPDVVICDEGHLLKNEKTSLSQAVTRMRTKRRIVLTGTPLQNNLKEYYCMIQFIKPNLLGTYKEYLNRFVNPISNGQYTDSTPRDIRLMKHRSHILHKMLEAWIQSRDYSVLAPYLPPKHEYVVFCTLSEKQKEIYEHYMAKQRDILSELGGVPGKGAKLFQDFQNLRRIVTHPMSLRVNSDTVIKKKMAQYDSEDSINDFVVEDSEDSSSSISDSSSSFGEVEPKESKSVRYRNTRANKADVSDNDDCLEIPVKEDPSEWWTQFIDETDLNNINHSPKLVLLMTILQRCEDIGDKVLVFSQSLQSLDVIEHFLSLIDKKSRGQEIEADIANFRGLWKPGVDYFRLDGTRTVENRESMCRSFNNVTNLKARLFLISTRAGGLGINLVAANRVVIFDVSWNPSHDIQSIFRVYRFGQNKPCYIYRLIALGTMEQKIYERQVAKQATAKRVIDEQQISRHYNQSDLQELYTYELEPITPREIPILPKDRLFAELLSNYEKLVFKYHEHDSLLEKEDSENLSEEERKAAWDEYEAEKKNPPQMSMQYMNDRQNHLANYGNPVGTVTSNKIFGFRSDVLLQLFNMKGCQDHPELTNHQVLQLVPEYLKRLYHEMNNDDPTLYLELIELHKSLEAPGGMYMNPLLFANQTPAPASYMGSYRAPYAEMNPSTSNFNSDEVYELE